MYVCMYVCITMYACICYIRPMCAISRVLHVYDVNISAHFHVPQACTEVIYVSTYCLYLFMEYFKKSLHSITLGTSGCSCSSSPTPYHTTSTTRTCIQCKWCGCNHLGRQIQVNTKTCTTHTYKHNTLVHHTHKPTYVLYDFPTPPHPHKHS